MRAIERIKRYGLVDYIETCLHKEPTSDLIRKYQEKYGADIPIDRPVKYRYTTWYIKAEREGVVKDGTETSKVHLKPDDERDLEEAFRKLQYRWGGSGWTIITYKKKKTEYIRKEVKKPKAETIAEIRRQERARYERKLKRLEERIAKLEQMLKAQ